MKENKIASKCAVEGNEARRVCTRTCARNDFSTNSSYRSCDVVGFAFKARRTVTNINPEHRARARASEHGPFPSFPPSDEFSLSVHRAFITVACSRRCRHISHDD